MFRSKQTILYLVLASSLIACGDSNSDNGDTPNNPTTDASMSPVGAQPDASAATGLLDNTAGAGCLTSPDCGGKGQCATMLTGGAGTQALGVPPMFAPAGYCTLACNDSSTCGAGGVCFGAALGAAGECRKACTTSADCRDHYECAVQNANIGFDIPSTCQPLPTTVQLADDQAGKLCQSNAECGAGTCDAAGGGVCTGACAKDSDCGAGGLCVPGLYGSAGQCAEACQTSADCQNAAAGWGCPSQGDRRTCQPQLAEGAVGNACSAASQASDCPGGSCRENAYGVDYPGGYCVGGCSADADCGTGGVCIDNAVCLKGCSSSGDCRDGYECIPHPLAMTTTGVPICYPIVPDAGAPDAGAADAGKTDAGKADAAASVGDAGA